MQIFPIYIDVSQQKNVLTDSKKQPVTALPVLSRGVAYDLQIHIFYTDDLTDVFSADTLKKYASFDFTADNDYSRKTTPKWRVSDGITVDDSGVIHVPLTETNTAELADFLGTLPNKMLKCELVGILPDESKPNFVLQFDVLARNRIGSEGTGTPEPVTDGTYSAAQVDALILNIRKTAENAEQFAKETAELVGDIDAVLERLNANLDTINGEVIQ